MSTLRLGMRRATCSASDDGKLKYPDAIATVSAGRVDCSSALVTVSSCRMPRAANCTSGVTTTDDDDGGGSGAAGEEECAAS